MELSFLHIRLTINTHFYYLHQKEIKTLKKTSRIIAVVMVATLLVSLLAGCRNNQESDFEPPEFVFLPEFVALPDEVSDIRNLSFAGDKIYFSSWILLDEDNWTYATKLFSLDIDGTNLTELANYVPGGIHDTDSVIYMDITGMVADEDGNIWIAEMGAFGNNDFSFDDGPVEIVPLIVDVDTDDSDSEDDDEEDADRELPDSTDTDDEESEDEGAADDDEFFDEDDYFDESFAFQDFNQVMFVRKLDNTGAELLTVDISGISQGSDYFYISTFNLDSSGNVYIGTSDSGIYVLGSDGNVQFNLELTDWVDQLIRLPDGSIAFFGWTQEGRVVRKIDHASRSWGQTIELPQNAWQIFPGGGDYLLLYQDSSTIYGIDADTGESIRLLNWIESNVALDYLVSLLMLPDDRVMVLNQKWGRMTRGYMNEVNYELITLSRVPYSELPERTYLTLATIWMGTELRNHVIEFNKTNPTYRIHVTDYTEFNTEDDWSAGLTRLSTEIISGKVPDILDVSSLPFKQYVARGFLEDLYPFIDSDSEIGRSDFLEGVFRASEMDGGLYRVFPSFGINTLIGHPSVVGANIGWNMDEFKAVLNANPQADMPMGQWLTKDSFLQMAVMLGMDEYVDWATGEVHFDTGGFAQLLEFANTFPADFDYSGEMGDYIDEYELIATGRQIMAQMWISEFTSLQRYIQMFGGDIVFKGFPTDSRNGNTLHVSSGLAITTSSSDKDGAWEFIRGILSKEYQLDYVTWNFPTNKAAFDEFAAEAMKEIENEYDHSYYMNGMMIEEKPLSQAELNQIMALIDSASGIMSYDEALWNIITEGASDFFNGRSSANDAARIIQNRVSIYIAEQS